MLTLILKLVILSSSAALNALGGYHWLWCRRFVMPAIIAGFIAWHLHIWWIFFAMYLPFCVCLSLHDHNRGAWCSIDAAGASFALLATGHLHWYWFVLYCGGAYFVGWLVNNKLKLNQIPNDCATGAWLGSLVFYA